MNLPNKLTLSRIALTFFMMGFLFRPGVAAKVAACVIFVAACVTDLLDGWIARRYRQVSDLGKILDPIADKVLILGALLAFVQMQLVAAWMVVIILFRESLITGLRFFAARRGMVLAAESAGKHKTVSQMITIFVILVFLILRESMASTSAWSQRLEGNFRAVIFSLMGIAVALTIFSGASYLWQNRKLIRSL